MARCHDTAKTNGVCNMQEKIKDDVISRQAAIDAFEDTTFTKNEICRRITELPPAKPEIIRCKDCEWFRKECGWNCIEYTVCGISPTHHPIRREEDFCSKAERREE